MLTFIMAYFIIGLAIILKYCGKDMVKDIKAKKFNIFTVTISTVVLSMVMPVIFVYTFIEWLIGQS